ncbi:hypothetical protein BJX70DRAFT_389325 [Aspergillus crustosus]
MQFGNVPEFPFFCHICGVAPTWRGLLADSTLEHLNPEEDDFDHREYRFPDFMAGMRELGYDVRLLPPKSIRWLDAVRLVTNKNVDADTGMAVWLTPLTVYVYIDSGTFIYQIPPILPGLAPTNTTGLDCNVDGYLVHDKCFMMLEHVHQHLQPILLAPGLDLGLLWNWMERGLEDRNNDRVDWGFGDAFHGWTVMDPDGPFDCQPLLDLASASTQPGYSFSFNVKPSRAAPLDPESSVNVLSILPRELQLSILEHLPTSSVLNLFISSSGFRRHAEHLPSSYWKSRLFFHMPWCADIILSRIESAPCNRSGKGRVHFDRLLRFLREFYTSPGQEPDNENPEFKGLRNQHRIWMNCERIIYIVTVYDL